MGLGTTETIESLALVLIPPGNVLRSISEFRKYLWSVHGLHGARAWFDFPLLAWLGSPIDNDGLSRLAADFTHPFELLAPSRYGNAIFLPFPQAILDFVSGIQSRIPAADAITPHRAGPFEAGLGCHCASIGSKPVPEGTILAAEVRFPVRSKTCLLAQVSLVHSTDPELYSTWRVGSSTRVHGLR
jgi:hypothetical protein